MYSRAKLSSYEKLEFTISTTAPVSDWRALLEQLRSLLGDGCYAWPAIGFVSTVEDILANLDKTHHAYTNSLDEKAS